MLHALADQRQVRFEVQLEDAQRIGDVRGGGGDGDQWQYGIALADVVLDPLEVDRDVTLKEMETWMLQYIEVYVSVEFCESSKA